MVPPREREDVLLDVGHLHYLLHLRQYLIRILLVSRKHGPDSVENLERALRLHELVLGVRQEVADHEAGESQMDLIHDSLHVAF